MIVKQGHLKTHIESVQAKVEYIHVICMNIKLQHREFWRLIMNQSMKMSSTLVISVNIKENNRDIWILILNQSIRKSDIIVFNAIKNLEHRDIWRFTLNQFSFANGKWRNILIWFIRKSFILYHHQLWNFKQWILTFVRHFVNRT